MCQSRNSTELGGCAPSCIAVITDYTHRVQASMKQSVFTIIQSPVTHEMNAGQKWRVRVVLQRSCWCRDGKQITKNKGNPEAAGTQWKTLLIWQNT